MFDGARERIARASQAQSGRRKGHGKRPISPIFATRTKVKLGEWGRCSTKWPPISFHAYTIPNGDRAARVQGQRPDETNTSPLYNSPSQRHRSNRENNSYGPGCVTSNHARQTSEGYLCKIKRSLVGTANRSYPVPHQPIVYLMTKHPPLRHGTKRLAVDLKSEGYPATLVDICLQLARRA